MENKNPYLTVLKRITSILSSLSFLFIFILWLSCAHAITGYFNSFFIDAGQIITLGTVWDFAAQKFLPLISSLVYVLYLCVSSFIIASEIRKELPSKAKLSHLKIKLHLKVRASLLILNTVFGGSIICILVLCFLIFWRGNGAVLATIDKKRFNEGQIIPHLLVLDSQPQKTIKCVGLLGEFNSYTFVIFPNMQTKLIENNQIISIDSLVYKSKQLDPKKKHSIRDICPIPKEQFSLEPFLGSPFFNLIFKISNIVMPPEKLFN